MTHAHDGVDCRWCCSSCDEDQSPARYGAGPRYRGPVPWMNGTVCQQYCMLNGTVRYGMQWYLNYFLYFHLCLWHLRCDCYSIPLSVGFFVSVYFFSFLVHGTDRCPVPSPVPYRTIDQIQMSKPYRPAPNPYRPVPCRTLLLINALSPRKAPMWSYYCHVAISSHG